MVICLERGADLHMAQRIPLPLSVSCFTKIPIGFTFLVLAHPGSPGLRAVKRGCVTVCMVMQGRICVTVGCLSVCPIIRLQQQRAVGLLLSAPQAGDIDQQRWAPNSNGAQQQMRAVEVAEAEHRLVSVVTPHRHSHQLAAAVSRVLR